jgi:hypothetical protein
MVSVNFQVARGTDFQVKETVPGKQLQHMFQKRNPAGK